MKRRMISVLLCAAFLCGAAAAWPVPAAAAGGGDDPLISRGYLTETFLPQAKAALAATADRITAERVASAPSARVLRLSAGQRVAMGPGQQFTLLSGSAAVYTERGEVVNTAGGEVAENGPAALYSRYIVCEDASAVVDARADSVLKVSAGAEVSAGSPFSDITPGDWFYADVVSAVERGLVNGMTPTTYEPGSTLLASQCVKLAACMHQLWHTGAVTLQNSPEGTPWYRGYVDYALENGILEQEFYDYDAVIVRQRFVELFYRALPESAYPPINDIPDGSIPDVPPVGGMDCVPEIYAFYRAGILTGYTDTPGYAEYAFGPESTISRAEVAAIMNRMFDEAARIRFTIN